MTDPAILSIEISIWGEDANTTILRRMVIPDSPDVAPLSEIVDDISSVAEKMARSRGARMRGSDASREEKAQDEG